MPLIINNKDMSRILFIWMFLLLIQTGYPVTAQVEHNYVVGPGKTTCDSLVILDNDFEGDLERITNTTWRYTQSMHLNRPYGFRSADFYSCDIKTGFLVLLIDKTKYIYQKVPVSLWEEFTKTNDPDTFIKDRIENKFTLLE